MFAAFCAPISASTPFPRQEVVVDWTRSGVVADPSADPEIINTCQTPVSVEIDEANFTAGTAVSTLTGFTDAGACWPDHIENFTMYAYIPFTVTCGSGAKFKGYSVKNLGNRDVSDEGGCGQERDATWRQSGAYLEQYDNNPKHLRVRGMYFNFDRGREEVIRWIDLGELESSTEIKNHTFPLLPFPGGNRVLARPVLFVHGLNEYYDTAWGVKAYNSCTIGSVAVDPQQAASVNISGEIRGLAGAEYYRTTVSGGIGFQGVCQENGAPRKWVTPATQLTNLVFAPSFGDTKQKDAWNQVWVTRPPVLIGTSFDGQELVGNVETWIMESDATRNMTGTGWEVVRLIPGTRLEYNGQGTSKIGIVRAVMKFRVNSLVYKWNHQSYVPKTAGIVGLVRPYGNRQYSSATAPDIISRIQRLKMGADVNKNGLYFFNGFRNAGNGKLVQPLPWWNLAGPVFPNEPGESWTLYQALEQTLQMHYGDVWKTDASKQIDLVAHSRGGVSIREMLANASLNDPSGKPMPTGSANAANHIRTVVTSNTPHFGSYAATSWESMPGEFDQSLTKAIKDSAAFGMELADVTVDPTYVAAIGAGYMDGSRATEAVMGWFLSQPEVTRPPLSGQVTQPF